MKTEQELQEEAWPARSIKLIDDKYEFYTKIGNPTVYARRYGREWREFIGDKAVSALFHHAIELQERVESMEQSAMDRNR